MKLPSSNALSIVVFCVYQMILAKQSNSDTTIYQYIQRIRAVDY